MLERRRARRAASGSPCVELACGARLIDSASAAGDDRNALASVQGTAPWCRRSTASDPPRGAARSGRARRRRRPPPVTGLTEQVDGFGPLGPVAADLGGDVGAVPVPADQQGLDVVLGEGAVGVRRPSGRAAGAVRRTTPPCRCAGWPRPGSAPRCSGRGRARVRCSGCRRW